MNVLGIRFCAVAEEAATMAQFFTKGLGLPERDLGGDADTFSGCVIPAGEASWMEIWQKGEDMPAGLMLQIVVDDADAVAATARNNGVDVQGPMEAHGEKIYFAVAPGGLSVSFQQVL
jgi:predicted enzyme related to lactoylglutathione lyase